MRESRAKPVALTAARVNELLALRGTLKRTPEPREPLDETEVRLELDRVFAQLKGGRL